MAQVGDFEARIRGGTLLTAEVLYYMPDHPSLLQSFCWQTVDLAPFYPRLSQFLDHWRREIQAVVHSIRVAHASGLGAGDYVSLDKVRLLN